MSEKPLILDANGKPARAKGANCPQCGAGKEKRVRTGTYGPDKHDMCGECCYEFHGELTT